MPHVTAHLQQNSRVHRFHIKLALNPQKKYFRISFKDNGAGFNPRYKDRIFEVFHKLGGKENSGGSGIGLATCKKIIENYDGTITAESEMERGSTFSIYFTV